MSCHSKPHICNCGCCTNKSIKLDHRLQNWQDALSERRCLHKALGERLNRQPGELLMNASEELRKVKEEKQLLSYRNISYPPDKFRGCPSFWQCTEKLPNKCDGDKNYYLQKTLIEQCKPADIEHVEVQDRIYKEKDVLPRTRDVYQLWKNNCYRKEKMKQVLSKLQLIEPHKPNLEGLLVIGKNFLSNTDNGINAKQSQIDSTSIPENKLDEQKPTTDLGLDENIHKGVSLIIDGKLFVSDKSSFKKKHEFCVIFENYDVTSNKVATEYINLYNTGSEALRIYWKRVPPYELFGDITKRTSKISYFYFDKNEFILLPGDKIDFPFWFKTIQPGTYTETWQLETLPSTWPSDISVTVKFKALANIADLQQRCAQIIKKLEDRTRNSIIKETVSSIIMSATVEDDVLDIYSYGRKQVFEAANSLDAVSFRAKYLYNRNIVAQLEFLYSKIRQNDDPERWNYSIRDLKITAQKYDSNCSNTNRTTYAVDEVKQLVERLKKPSGCPNFKREQYWVTYSILNACFFKISIELADLENALGMLDGKKYLKVKDTLEDVPLRLILEHPDMMSLKENMLKPSYLTIKELEQQKPKPEHLKDVPENDPRRLYRAYYGIPDTPTEDDKKHEKTVKKEKKGNIKKKTSSTELVGMYNKQKKKKPKAIKDFDPDTPLEVFLEQTDESIDDLQKESESIGSSKPVSQSMKEQYDYNIYLIFYTNLCEAVDVIEESLERLNRKTELNFSEVRRLEECTIHHERIGSKKHKIGKLKEVVPELLASDKQIDNKPIVEAEDNFSSGNGSSSEVTFESKLSLWSVLKPYPIKPKAELSVPISYPENILVYPSEVEKLLNAKSTSTLEGGVIDPNWQQFKPVETQLSPSNEEDYDVVETIEYLKDTTSIQDLDRNRTVSCQKNEEDYVSDEEYFYDTPEETESSAGSRSTNS